MDAETDALIQETIRSSFQDCTTLTIAHRLHTVLASDRIMVLNQGQVRQPAGVQQESSRSGGVRGLVWELELFSRCTPGFMLTFGSC